MNVLIVEDNAKLAKLLADGLTERGDVARQAATLRAAEDVLRDFAPDAVLLDAMFPNDGGGPDFNAPAVLDLLENRTVEFRPFTILMSGDDRAASHFETIREWWHTGRIADMISKNPEGGWGFLKEILLHHLQLLRLTHRDTREVDSGEEHNWLEQNGVISRDPTIYRIARAIRRTIAVTGNRHNILIVGANGTGKTLFAKAIWNEMRGRNRSSVDLPFVDFHCGRVSPGTFLSELFGHTRGAFTGADSSRSGALEDSGEGVLFLDDIQGLPPDTRRALLGPLQDRTFRRLGASGNQDFRARVVSATNVDLEKLYNEGQMPDEFYNRIAGETVFVPPLSQRPEDIELIANAIADREPRPIKLRTDAVRALQAYGWPGNVRQLERVIDKIKVHHDSETVTLQSLRALSIDYLGKPIEWLPPGWSPASSAPVHVLGWSGSWSELGPGDEERVLGWLEKLGVNREQLDALVKSLANRASPKAIHYYRALLFVVLRGQKRAGPEPERLPHKVSEEALGLGWDYTNKVLLYLAGVRNSVKAGLVPLSTSSPLCGGSAEQRCGIAVPCC